MDPNEPRVYRMTEAEVKALCFSVASALNVSFATWLRRHPEAGRALPREHVQCMKEAADDAIWAFFEDRHHGSE